MTLVAINGVGGRMGQTLREAIGESDDLRLGVAIEHPNSPLIGEEVDGVYVVGDINAALEDFDVIVDFSIPQATLNLLDACTENAKGLVIGTTGFDDQGLKRIEKAATSIPIMMSPNMSIGVNVTFKLIEMAAQALGDEVDVEILEAHHRHKIDAPSGTAVRMGEILSGVLGRDLSSDAVYGRVGITGERDVKTIGFHSLRAGDLVGEHTVTYAGTGERIEITHRAQSRKNFAMGALRAVRYVASHDSGLFDMADVLSL